MLLKNWIKEALRLLKLPDRPEVEKPHSEISKAQEHSMVQEVQLVQFRALPLQGWCALECLPAILRFFTGYTLLS